MYRILILAVILVGVSAEIYHYPVTYKSLGCWNDGKSRAITSLEGHPLLREPYRVRALAIQKCGSLASQLGYDVFAIQNGGMCMASKSARKTYRSFGKSKMCRPDGKGGKSANQVYELDIVSKVSTTSLGCWRVSTPRAIPTLEKLVPILDGDYVTRKQAFEKCLTAAASRGHHVMALEGGGMCLSSSDGLEKYMTYGESDSCQDDGKGGEDSMQVYRLRYHWIKYYMI